MAEHYKFDNLRTITGFGDKLKNAGDPEYNHDDFIERHAQGKEFHQALVSDDNDQGISLKSIYKNNLPGDIAVFDAQIEEIYGAGSAPVVRKLIEAQVKSNKQADRQNIDYLDTQKLSEDVANYYSVSNKSAVETMTQSAAEVINADRNLTPAQRKEGIARAREAAQRRVDEDEDGILTTKEIEGFGTELEEFTAKELEKVGKFDHQSFLLGNIDGLSALSRRRFDMAGSVNRGIRRVDDDKILSLTDSATNPLSKLRRKDKGYGLLALPTEKLSQLVPTIKIFKIFGISNEVEIPFPTKSLIYANTGKNFRASGITAGSEDPKNFFKNRDGFGIKSFTWDLSGKTEVTGKTDIKAKLSLYFQDFAQFITPRRNTKGESFKYLDLILEAAKLEDAPKGAVQYLKIVAGWTIPPSSSGAGSFTDEELDIIRENTISLKLGFVGYAIVFNDSGNGTFELSIEYQAWSGEFTTDKFVNVLLPSEDSCEILGKLSKTIADAQANNQDEVGGKKITVLETERNDLQKKLIPETQTQILERLTEAGSIYRLSVSAAAVLNFQGVHTDTIDLALIGVPNNQKNIEVINSLADVVSESEGVITTPAEDDSGNVKIYYTFLGDIIQAAMMNSLNEKKLNFLNKPDAKQANFIRVLTTDVKFGETSVNIADIPIDIRFFASWFFTRITNLDASEKSLEDFISELLAYMVENRIETFFSEKTGERKSYLTTWLNFENSVTGLLSSKTAKLKSGTAYSYLGIYAQPTDGSTTSRLTIKKGKYAQAKRRDQGDGIYHFILGDADSIVKNASFEKTDLKFEASRRIVEGTSAYAALRNVFMVNLRLYGNTLFWPGSQVFINPSHAVGDGGHPWIPGSIFNIMGFGGYHNIISVKNTISDNTFETALETKFENSGNPPGAGAKNKTKSGLVKGEKHTGTQGGAKAQRTEGGETN